MSSNLLQTPDRSPRHPLHPPLLWFLGFVLLLFLLPALAAPAAPPAAPVLVGQQQDRAQASLHQPWVQDLMLRSEWLDDRRHEGLAL